MILLSAAVFTAAALAPAETIDLKHAHKQGAVSKYEFKVTGNEGGMDLEMVATWTQKIGKKGSRGGPSLTLTDGTVSMSQGGQDAGTEDGVEMSLSLDKHGMPATFYTDGNDIFFLAGQICQYLPAKKIEVGEEFKIKWKAGGAELLGEGTLKGKVKLDGKDMIRVSYNVDMVPADSEPSPMEYDTWFDAKTLQAVKTTGIVEIQGGEFEFTLKLLK